MIRAHQALWVSAIIPTRNRPELVRRAVRSVPGQTCEHVEAIVVVDGPNSATRVVLEELRDPRVRMISLEESVGGGEARNIGVAAAAGQWIALLDDDEEWLSEKVSAQLRLAAQESDEGVVVVSNFIALKGCQDLDWFLRIMAHPGVKLCVTQEPLTVYYVPESRASVSREFSWQFRMGWGCSQKHLMTARAYSRFVVSVCATKAALEPFSLRAFLVLLRECLFAGRPNVRTVMHLLALFLMPDKVHQAVRDLLAVPLGRPVTASNSSIS